MKKLKLLVPVILFASQSAFSASFSSQCAGNELRLNYDLAEGELCSIEQAVTINGDENVKNLENIDVDTNEVFALQSGDSVAARVTLRCTNASGAVSASSSSVSSSNGCSNGVNGVEGAPGISGAGNIEDIDGQLEQRLIAELETQSANAVSRLQSSANRIERFTSNPRFVRLGLADRFLDIFDRQIDSQRDLLERTFQDRVSDDVLLLQLETFDLEVEAIRSALSN